jgi:hypothetical protein
VFTKELPHEHADDPVSPHQAAGLAHDPERRRGQRQVELDPNLKIGTARVFAI